MWALLFHGLLTGDIFPVRWRNSISSKFIMDNPKILAPVSFSSSMLIVVKSYHKIAHKMDIEECKCDKAPINYSYVDSNCEHNNMYVNLPLLMR